MNFNRIYAIILRHLYVWPRGLERFMWSVGWPLLDLLIWGITTSYLQKNSLLTPSIATIILGGIIFWGMVSRVQLELSVTFLEELWNKNLINIFASPLSISEFIISSIILGVIKLMFSATILVGTALFFYNFNVFVFNWYLPLLLINLILFGWAFGFFVTGLLIRYGRNMEEFAWSMIYFFQPFVGVYYPLSALPSWAQFIGRLMPPTYIFEEMRRFMMSGTIKAENLLISFSLNIIYMTIALVYMKLMFEKARETGRLTKLEG